MNFRMKKIGIKKLSSPNKALKQGGDIIRAESIVKR